MAKETFYFRHDYNARNDDKILELRAKFGAEGYGIFWMIIETMAENENGGAKAGLMGGLSLGYGIAKDRLKEIISYCIEIGLFYEDGGAFFSKRLLTHKEFRTELSKNGSLGALKRWKKDSGAIAGLSGGNGNPNAKERKGKERKELYTDENFVDFSVFGLGAMKVSFNSNCEKWQIKELKDFLVNSQQNFESLAMSNPVMNNLENFNIALQQFVNMIQSANDYKESNEFRRYFSNWISKKNGTLKSFIESSKNTSENKRSKNSYI
jgi:hypothetical protein